MLLENWPAPIRSALFTLLGVNWSHRLLNDMAADRPSKQVLLERLFARNHFDVQVSGAEKIPQNKGCVFASNHPHGLFDGLGAMWLGCKYGHDSRAIGRHFLSVFEPIRDWFLLLKVDANRRGQASKQTIQEAAAFIADGGSLVVTPAGRVGVSRPLWTPAQDLPWKPGAVRFSQAANAPIVLVYVDVNHSVARQVGQWFHGVVRALMQVWAYRLGCSLKLHLHVLDVVMPEQLPEGSVQQQTAWLQAHFEKLAAEVVSA